jgi:hypothetical protein
MRVARKRDRKRRLDRRNDHFGSQRHGRRNGDDFDSVRHGRRNDHFGSQRHGRRNGDDFDSVRHGRRNDHFGSQRRDRRDDAHWLQPGRLGDGSSAASNDSWANVGGRKAMCERC